MEIAQIYKQLNEEAQRQAEIGQKQKRRRQLATAARIGKTWVRKLIQKEIQAGVLIDPKQKERQQSKGIGSRVLDQEDIDFQLHLRRQNSQTAVSIPTLSKGFAHRRKQERLLLNK